jgi:hypothetical protein
VTTDATAGFAASRRMPDMDGVPEIERANQFREVVGLSIQIVAIS